ncbi:MAG: outer membrane lipoprotein-sorting protein [Armatimonadetes bacterium]|nr:outer membrane lipoprotein-sorting protein [Armatimonadota bacterium]
MRVIFIAVMVFLLGFVLCPRTPNKDRVDPDELASDMLRVMKRSPDSDRPTYTATRLHTYTIRAESVQFRTKVRYGDFGERITMLDAPSASSADFLAMTRAMHITSFLDSFLRKTKWTPLVEGEEKIVGRDAWIVRFKPDRKRVPWAHCWIDKETFVVLAARVWDGHNCLIGSFKTTKITY